MKIKLWTIQRVEFLENLLEEGVAYGKRDNIEREGFIEGYQWMMDRMEQKVGKKPFEGCFPLWAWYQWKDARYRKPHLGSACHNQKGTKCVRLEIEKDLSEVLLSDFMLWHFPLSYRDFIGYRADTRMFNKKLKQEKLYKNKFEDWPAPIKQEVVNSWDLIFDMDFDEEHFTSSREKKSIQATFWSLRPEEIRKTEYFTAR